MFDAPIQPIATILDTHFRKAVMSRTITQPKRLDPKTLPEIARRMRLLRQTTRWEGDQDNGVPLSVAEFAKETGIARTMWHNIEAGFSRIGVDAAMKLCDRFHLTLDWIFRGDERFLTKSFVDKLARAARELDDQDRLGHLGS